MQGLAQLWVLGLGLGLGLELEPERGVVKSTDLFTRSLLIACVAHAHHRVRLLHDPHPTLYSSAVAMCRADVAACRPAYFCSAASRSWRPLYAGDSGVSSGV